MPRTARGILLALTFAALIGGGEAVAGNAVTPFERAAGTPRGQLHSPYADFASVAEEGHKIYLSHDCNGCHGGGGGGGMAAPLTNEVWIYGDDDDTLFRVIAPKPEPGRCVSEAGLCSQGLRERGRADATFRRNLQDRRRHLENHRLDQGGELRAAPGKMLGRAFALKP